MTFTRRIKRRNQIKKTIGLIKQALEDFLETLREQPVKEMNDRWNKWIMFSKRLERNMLPERRIHDAWPTLPRDTVLPPICVAAETGIYNQFIGRCKGSVWDAHWGKS